MMGQTSFAGYMKVICVWWLNDCPDILESATEFQTISGMQRSDYNRYMGKIEPLLFKSFALLKKYRTEQHAKRDYCRRNILKAQAARSAKAKARATQSNKPAAIVDKHTPVNPAPAAPDFKPFHEGWNLNKSAPAAKTPRQQKAFLKDK